MAAQRFVSRRFWRTVDSSHSCPTLSWTLGRAGASINRFAWSPDGRCLAVPYHDGCVQVFQRNNVVVQLAAHESAVTSVAWSPDGTRLATTGNDSSVRIWDLAKQECVCHIGVDGQTRQIDWSADGQMIALSVRYGHIWRAHVRHLNQPRVPVELGGLSPNQVSWSRSGTMLVMSGNGTQARLVRPDRLSFTLRQIDEIHGSVVASDFTPDDTRLVFGTSRGSILVYALPEITPCLTLEGHTAPVVALSCSADGRLLASKSADRTVRLWNPANGDELAVLPEKMALGWRNVTIAFNPCNALLASCSRTVGQVRVWSFDTSELLRSIPTRSQTFATAKVVVVGESSVGKSCLALRLAHDEYHEQGTTHGMRFWNLPIQAPCPHNDDRERSRTVFLWDLGGQEEYRLIHQLFLHDTSAAIVLFDPTRGRVAFDEVRGWNQRLEKQLGGRSTRKLLIGSKLDTPSALVDHAAVDRLVQECKFEAYIETSAKTGRGIAELREKIAQLIDWNSITNTTRPELFQAIRSLIEQQQAQGQILLSIAALYLEAGIAWAAGADGRRTFDASAVDLVVRQLSVQGLIAETRLASKDRVLILRVSEIERYAGSIIVAARNNRQGVPALEVEGLLSRRAELPGLGAEGRLEPIAERVVLECVTELLLEHDICFRHQGLLIFPSLFPIGGGSFDTDLENIAINYDFSGAIDNIYASLVTRLVLSQSFGRARLREDRAEFALAENGMCGIQKRNKAAGYAELDVFFDSDCAAEKRRLFTVFVEEHLAKEGVNIAENLIVQCPNSYPFERSLVRQRALRGTLSILCPACETRHPILPGADQARESHPEVQSKLLGLKTRIDTEKRSAIFFTKRDWRRARDTDDSSDKIRILHLSDLHVPAGADVRSWLEPLLADLKDVDGGSGGERFEGLVISGDIAMIADPKEFESALEFVTGLVRAINISAQHCVVVPGNHDLEWLMPYDWSARKKNDTAGLAPDEYVETPQALARRNKDKYELRFKNYSDFFHHPFYQREYPRRVEEQYSVTMLGDTGIIILGLNTAWYIDELHKERSSIHLGALERGLHAVAAQEAEYLKSLPEETASTLKLAVWHHPVSGTDAMQDNAFLERLRQSGFSACLHGHVHESRADLIGYTHPRQLNVIGGGSFGATRNERPESIPYLYNVIEVARDFSSITVHTRSRKTIGAAWEGWANWPGSTARERRTYYQFVPGRAPARRRP